MIKYSDMDAASEDMLKEIGNIGTGNAITALSAMVGKTFSVGLPEIRIVNYQDQRRWKQASCLKSAMTCPEFLCFCWMRPLQRIF